MRRLLRDIAMLSPQIQHVQIQLQGARAPNIHARADLTYNSVHAAISPGTHNDIEHEKNGPAHPSPERSTRREGREDEGRQQNRENATRRETWLCARAISRVEEAP